MLREPDIRAIIRLLGEVSASEQDLSQKKRHLLSGLCGLIDGDTWVWSLNRRADKKMAALCMDSMSGGGLADSLPERCPATTLTLASPRRPSEVALDQANESRPTLTVRQISEDVVSSIRIARRTGRPSFAPREIKMAQIILSEIPWLHDKYPCAEVGTNQDKSLSPRQRAILVYLINGLSRQEIAEQLRISSHTVHGYIKDIFKHHRVNSRAELVRQFTLGWQQRT